MSVYNRKLFFNRGGQVNARGTGITSGLTPVQNFQTGGQVDPMDPYRQAVWSGMMSNKTKQGPIGGFIDVFGQSTGAAIPLLPKAKEAGERRIIKCLQKIIRFKTKRVLMEDLRGKILENLIADGNLVMKQMIKEKHENFLLKIIRFKTKKVMMEVKRGVMLVSLDINGSQNQIRQKF